MFNFSRFALSSNDSCLQSFLPSQIPDPIKQNPKENEPTGWETHLNSIESYTRSFALSNLGRFSLEPSSTSNPDPLPIEDFAWCQSPSISSVPLSIDVCGLPEREKGEGGGLSVSFGFRDGILSREAVEKVARKVEQTLHDLSEGKIAREAKVWDMSRTETELR